MNAWMLLLPIAIQTGAWDVSICADCGGGVAEDVVGLIFVACILVPALIGAKRLIFGKDEMAVLHLSDAP